MPYSGSPSHELRISALAWPPRRTSATRVRPIDGRAVRTTARIASSIESCRAVPATALLPRRDASPASARDGDAGTSDGSHTSQHGTCGAGAAGSPKCFRMVARRQPPSSTNAHAARYCFQRAR